MGVSVKAGKAAKVTESVDIKHGDSGEEYQPHNVSKDSPVEAPDPCAVVSVEAGRTIGLPNYSSARVCVTIALPCAPDAIDDTYDKAEQWCLERLDHLQAEALE